MKTALEIVHDGLAGSEARLMLIGAYALHAYDVVRQTLDLGDIVELLRAHPLTVSGEELRETCEQYGPVGVYDKLKDHL